jgi:hypothetical protein
LVTSSLLDALYILTWLGTALHSYDNQNETNGFIVGNDMNVNASNPIAPKKHNTQTTNFEFSFMAPYTNATQHKQQKNKKTRKEKNEIQKKKRKKKKGTWHEMFT